MLGRSPAVVPAVARRVSHSDIAIGFAVYLYSPSNRTCQYREYSEELIRAIHSPESPYSERAGP